MIERGMSIFFLYFIIVQWLNKQMRRNCFFCGSLSLFRVLLLPLLLLLYDDHHLNVEVIITLTIYAQQKLVLNRCWSSNLLLSLSLQRVCCSLKVVDQHYIATYICSSIGISEIPIYSNRYINIYVLF